MIISFTVENWMSFRDRVTFSMVASKERQHGDRVAKIAKYTTKVLKVLPIAAIYGGNASGKTNFFKALSFMKKMVVIGTQPDDIIPVEVFRLDDGVLNKPACFLIEIVIDDDIYEYSFSVTQQSVVEEKLVLIKSASEKTLYHRMGNHSNFDKSMVKDDFLQFAFRGTRDNQLFLNNSVSQNLDTFRPIYNWFKDSLVLITPDSHYQFDDFHDEDSETHANMSEILSLLDTGIARLCSENISIDNIPVSEKFKTTIREKLKEGSHLRLGEGLIITRKNGELAAKKLNTYHQKENGEDVKFEILDESDGTQRLIDLLPAFFEISVPKSKKVYFIDEIDRSLHTLLTRKLLESYLNRCANDTRTQLILTTHDVLLMDQNLLRRDEMWVTEREISGNTKLYSLSEYKDLRYDKDIQTSYLQGRLGGVPRILLHGPLKE